MSPLIQALVKKGILGKEKAASLEFEVKGGVKEEEVILEKRIVSEDFLFNLKAEILKVSLKKFAIEDVPLKTLELIPEESARFYQMIPLFIKENALEVGMVYPEDLQVQEAIKFLARQGKFEYKIFLITITDFKELLKKYRTLKREVSRALEELEVEMKAEKVERKPTSATELERLVEEAPISKVVAVMLRHAVEGDASDIHIEPTRDKLRVRFRLLGSLHSSLLLPLRIHPAVVARIKILSNLKIDENRTPQDGRFTTKIEDKFIDFRVSTFPTTMGEKVVIRVLDPSMGLKSFNELGLADRNFVAVKAAMEKSYGLILTTGPTGCGKTTTLYSILRDLNKEDVNITTLEDPVEYYIDGVNQSQVHQEIGYTFANGLRSIVRQDPDIIMVGEIRDEETASLAIHAALTGHIVLSTIHTNNAAGVFPRFIDLGVKPYLLPSTLSVSIAQRLVRTLCPECKKQIKPRKEVQDIIMAEIANLPDIIKKTVKIPKPFVIYEATGCKKCNHQGFSGRAGVFEVVSMSDSIADIVLSEPSEAKISAQARLEGTTSMKQDGMLKVLEGITTFEEILRTTEEK